MSEAHTDAINAQSDKVNLECVKDRLQGVLTEIQTLYGPALHRPSLHDLAHVLMDEIDNLQADIDQCDETLQEAARQHEAFEHRGYASHARYGVGQAAE